MQEPDNFQLYVLIRNEKLHPQIRNRAAALWKARTIPEADLHQIEDRYQAMFRPDEDRPLKKRSRLLVMLLPFAPEAWIIQAIISSRLLAYGHRKRWRAYWQAVWIGHLLWLIALFVLAGLYF